MSNTVKQFNVFDKESGELLFTKTSKSTSPFGRGWAVFNKAKLRDLVKNEDPYVLAVWLWLMSKQTYEVGIPATVLGITKAVGFNRNLVAKCLNRLTDKKFLAKIEVDGEAQWLLNPTITGCGKEATIRRRTLWSMQESYSGVADSPLPVSHTEAGIIEVEDEDGVTDED